MALIPPSSDLLIPPQEPLQLCCDLKKLPRKAEHNGDLLNSSNDKLIRWQEWWSGLSTKKVINTLEGG
jgi:hypothetical protein